MPWAKYHSTYAYKIFIFKLNVHNTHTHTHFRKRNANTPNCKANLNCFYFFQNYMALKYIYVSYVYNAICRWNKFHSIFNETLFQTLIKCINKFMYIHTYTTSPHCTKVFVAVLKKAAWVFVSYTSHVCIGIVYLH